MVTTSTDPFSGRVDSIQPVYTSEVSMVLFRNELYISTIGDECGILLKSCHEVEMANFVMHRGPIREFFYMYTHVIYDLEMWIMF